MKNIWSDNNAPELTPAGYVKVALTHNLPVFSCVSQAQYINSLAIKFVTDFVLASKNPSGIPGFKLGSSQKTESMVTPVFATPILTTSWLA
ncbi:hypothetical protein MUTS7_00350 (plasmid) [Escherichia coli]|nr:hypothetical protein MUTS7_00350 [Escherichia coli]